MNRLPRVGALLTAGMLAASPAHAEILAMVIFETKAEESIKALQMQSSPQERREGIAIIDLDPESENFGRILLEFPLPPDLLGHHIYYNKDLTKAYVTGFGRGELRVIDLTRNPWRIRTVELSGCTVPDHVLLSGDNTRWWVTCVGSKNVIFGDAVRDRPLAAIHLPKPYPHGIALHQGIDRILVTNVHSPYDYGDPQETLSVIRASTNEVLGTVRLARGPSPAVESPAGVLFVPGSDPPAAYVNNVDSGHMWLVTWNPEAQDFDARFVFDYNAIGSLLPILLYYNRAGDRLYTVTMSPGRFHIFDISGDLSRPTLINSLDCANGAHHAAFTPDERYAFIQNGLLNLPGLSEGSITIVDLQKEQVIGSVDTFKELGLTHKHILLLPEWYHPMGW